MHYTYWVDDVMLLNGATFCAARVFIVIYQLCSGCSAVRDELRFILDRRRQFDRIRAAYVCQTYPTIHPASDMYV